MAGLKGKKILVTGASGFIGSHLCEELVNRRAIVIGYDNTVDPNSYFVRNRVYSDINFKVLDIRERDLVERAVASDQPDFIIHLAAQTLVTTAIVDPYNTLETNVMGTVNFLEAVRKLKGIERIICASSDKAYGKTTETYTEEHPLKGDHPYDVSKSAGDLICSAYYQSYGTPIVVTRFGNVYGEGDMHFDRIVPGICYSLIKKQKLKIRSNGKFVRDYLYVKDVVEGYINLLLQDRTVNGHAFNFSSKDTLNVLELIAVAQKALDQEISYEIMNNAKNEIPYQHLNDEKMQKMGWKNLYTLSQTFSQIYTWYEKALV